MQPEQRARVTIDDLLCECGWQVQDRASLNLGAGRGIAIREFSLTTGAADYLLFVDRQAVGAVEAKKVGETLTGVEEQSAKYRLGLPAGLPAARQPLPFAYETTGVETRFTSHLDPAPRSRPVFAFHRPETIADWLAQAPVALPADANDTLRARLRRMPPLTPAGLRDCQLEAITNLERSFAENRPRALIQMATGSGKTYTATSAVYRLIKHAGARRVLFLVDRANLGRQTLKEFQQFITPDDGRKFTELYNVQHLQSNRLDPVARVCVTTIQRLYSMLAGEPELDPSAEEASLFELGGALANQPPKEVRYNPAIPIETFDVIITDECHRSIYNLWRGVLEYFDAFIVGLTATPNKQTFGFFNKNLVMEYGHDRAVADGVNVDYAVYRIRTDVTERGGAVERGFYVDKRDRQTRARRWEQLDDDLTFDAAKLDREIVVPDQIRTVIRAFKDALASDLFPGRAEVPKTLIFAKDDSHADDIVQIVREEFAAGNEFAQKITYKVAGVKPEDLIASFRNSYFPRIAVTVDMISTGTDIKPLEVLLFMRSVKSHGFFEQMKGRGTRIIADSDLQTVTPSAHTKTHFVLVDAVGVCERLKSDEPPLDRKRSVAFAKLLESVALGMRDDDTLASLAARLGRLAARATPAEAAAVAEAAGGTSIRQLAQGLVDALDPDRRLDTARAATGQPDPDARALAGAAQTLAFQAAAPFDNPALRAALATAQRRDEQTIAPSVVDTVNEMGWAEQVEKDRATIQSWRAYIETHKDEIAALQLLYNTPRRAGLRLDQIKQLAATIRLTQPALTTDTVWQAYDRLDRARVRGASAIHQAADLISLIRYTLERDRDPDLMLEPYAETVRARFAAWLAEQERQRARPFTAEQRQWLEMIRDHVTESLTIERDDFDLDPFAPRGGLGKAYQLFGDEFPTILRDLNERLSA